MDYQNVLDRLELIKNRVDSLLAEILIPQRDLLRKQAKQTDEKRKLCNAIFNLEASLDCFLNAKYGLESASQYGKNSDVGNHLSNPGEPAGLEKRGS